jgi:hypothetical protein
MLLEKGKQVVEAPGNGHQAIGTVQPRPQSLWLRDGGNRRQAIRNGETQNSKLPANPTLFFKAAWSRRGAPVERRLPVPPGADWTGGDDLWERSGSR